MRRLIAALKSNTCAHNSMTVLMRVNGLILSLMIAASGFAFAEASDEKAWLACEQNADCTSIKLGCWYWSPVNKKYVDQMRTAHFVTCKESADPGPQPAASCVDHVCVNDGYRGRDWGVVGYTEVDRRIDACLEKAGLNADWTNHTVQHLALRNSYVQKVESAIRQDASTMDKRVDEIVTSEIPCQEVVTKIKLLTTKLK
jgi:hypothetical protein